MKLMETEAEYRNREDEIEARDAGVDPELLLQRRIKDLLKKDPAITSLMKEIEQVQRKVDQADYQSRPPARTSPSVIREARQLEAMKQALRVLIVQKKEKLTVQARNEDEGAVSLRELKAQIDSLKARKSSYEKLLSQLRVANEKLASVAARMALVREDLASLREMRASVEKRIVQLEFDARAANPR